jgi:hypothetical protein
MQLQTQLQTLTETTPTPLVVKITEGIYVANALVSLPIVLKMYNISAIIQLEANDVLTPTTIVDTYDYALSGQELLDYEVQPMTRKLDTICDDIRDLRESQQNILLQCVDGRNKSLLVVGYYLVKRLKQDPQTVVTTLTQIYFTSEQVSAEVEDLSLIHI